MAAEQLKRNAKTKEATTLVLARLLCCVRSLLQGVELLGDSNRRQNFERRSEQENAGQLLCLLRASVFLLLLYVNRT